MAIVTRREFWDRLELALYGKTGNTFGAATALGIDALYDDLVAQPAPATVTRERELLRELVALVRGECPSLLNEDSGGDVRLSMAIDDALASPPAEDENRAKLAEVIRDVAQRLESCGVMGRDLHLRTCSGDEDTPCNCGADDPAEVLRGVADALIWPTAAQAPPASDPPWSAEATLKSLEIGFCSSNCGPVYRADEDGCCVTCGGDITFHDRSWPLGQTRCTVCQDTALPCPAMPPIEVGDWLIEDSDPIFPEAVIDANDVDIYSQPDAQAAITEIRKASGTVWTREPRR